jgi:hypothetical protein
MFNKSSSSLRNLEEFNTLHLFNSTSIPLSISNITNMAANLEDDINLLIKKLLNNTYFNNIKNFYESFKTNLNGAEKIIQFVNELFQKQFSLLFPYNDLNAFDYLENLLSYQINESYEKDLSKIIFDLLNINEDNSILNTLPEFSSGIIITTYNNFKDLINNCGKVITVKDIENNALYLLSLKNPKAGKYLNFLKENRIFEKAINFIDNFSGSFYDLFNLADIEFNISILNTEISVDLTEGKEFVSVKKCIQYNPLEDYNLSHIFLELDNPIVPLRIDVKPVANFACCIGAELKHDNDTESLKLSFNLNLTSIISLELYGGIYFDISVIKASATVGINGTVFEGKVGMKLSIDILQGQLYAAFYMDLTLFSIEFNIYFELEIFYLMDLDKKFNKKIPMKKIPFCKDFIVNLDDLEDYSYDSDLVPSTCSI